MCAQTIGKQVGANIAGDRPANTAAAAEPADAGNQIAGARNAAGNIDPASTAAAANRLNDDRRMLIAISEHREISVRRAKGQMRGACISAGATKTTNTERNGAAGIAGDRQLAGDIHTAIAAAATLALDHHTISVFCTDIALNIGRDITGIAAFAAKAAEPESEADALALGRRHAAGNIDPAIAAAAANALRCDPVGAVTMGKGRTFAHKRDVAGPGCCVATESADANRGGTACTHSKRHCASEIEAAIAAAASETLGQNPERIGAESFIIASDRDSDIVRCPTIAAKAANPDRERSACRAAPIGREGAGNVQATIAAAAAQALRNGTERTVTISDHLPVEHAGDRTTAAAAATKAADPNANRAGRAGGQRDDTGDIDAAIAAAASKALQQNAVSAIAARDDRTGEVTIDRGAKAAIAAKTAYADTKDAAAQNARGADAARDVQAAIAATAAQALEGDAEGIIAGDHPFIVRIPTGRAGRNIGFDTAINSPAIAAIAAETANTDKDIPRRRSRSREATGDIRAAITAAAAQTLDQHGRGSVALGRDIAPDQCVGHDHVWIASNQGIAAIAAGSADSNRNIGAVCTGKTHRARDIDAATAAAATDRLNNNCACVIAGGPDRAERIVVIGDEFIEPQRRLPAIAAAAAGATGTNADRTARIGGQAHRIRRIQTATAAAAANTLGNDAVAAAV